jgi:predicted nucleotidyltransferase
VDAELGTDVDRQRLTAVCRRYGIAALLVFGSAARGMSTASSDLELL